MVNYETMRALISCPNKEALMAAVNKLTEEDAKLSLVMAILCWKHGNKINEEIDRDLRRRIAELENK